MPGPGKDKHEGCGVDGCTWFFRWHIHLLTMGTVSQCRKLSSCSKCSVSLLLRNKFLQSQEILQKGSSPKERVLVLGEEHSPLGVYYWVDRNILKIEPISLLFFHHVPIYHHSSLFSFRKVSFLQIHLYFVSA